MSLLLAQLWRRFELPSYLINGLSAALGVGAVLLLAHQWGGSAAAWLVSSGAACASLADQPGTPRRVAWSVSVAAVLASLATAVAWLTPPGWPTALGVGLVAGVASMAMAWGPRAGSLSFIPVLAMVFAFGHVRGAAPVSWQLGCTAVGTLGYGLWAVGSAWVLQPLYRRRALAGALQAMAMLLRSRAQVVESAASVRALSELIGIETLLATRLQAARDLLFADTQSLRGRNRAALLLRIIDLRDTLMASRLDVDRLGSDAPGLWLRQRLAGALRALAQVLEDEAEGAEAQAQELQLQVHALLAARNPVPADDPRQRLLAMLQDRLRLLVDEVLQLQQLRRGAEETLPLSAQELQLFVTPEAFPLAALWAHRAWASPVLRHALRTALALGCAYLIAQALPWQAHPHWLVLSVAVVLRGNLEQTLSRRNARVLGTALGCVLVLMLSWLQVPWLHQLVFLLALAVAHAFVGVRYWVTATAATMMALLQAQLVHGAAGWAVAERLADTLLGAVLALAFSYVLPAWERRSVPEAIARTLRALEHYAQHALVLGARPTLTQRLARRAVYDALAGLAAATQRSTVEPRHVQLPINELSHLLDHGQQLLAELSILRALLVRRAAVYAQEPEAAAALAAALQGLQQGLRRAYPSEQRSGQAPGEPAAQPAEPLAPEVLPEQPPAQNPMPWLLRRLHITVQDGHRVGEAAAVALRSLG